MAGDRTVLTSAPGCAEPDMVGGASWSHWSPRVVDFTKECLTVTVAFGAGHACSLPHRAVSWLSGCDKNR